jgi:hypothetical protein
MEARSQVCSSGTSLREGRLVVSVMYNSWSQGEIDLLARWL